MKLTQQQTQVIIDNGKVKGLSTKSIIDSLVKNGYEPEGVNVEGIKQTLQQTQPVEQNKESFRDKVKTAFQDSSVFGNGQGILDVKDGEVSLNKEKAQELIDFSTGFVGGAGGAIKDKVISNIKSVLPKIETKIKGEAGQVIDDIKQVSSKVKNKLQINIAKGNVSPQLESSASRLSSESNILKTYDDYLAQSKKSALDITMDKPIETVGGKIGDAFETVIKQRSDVGKVLGNELTLIGKTKVSIAGAKNKLLSELKDSGLSYNSKTKQLTSFQGSKFAPEEVSMLDDFTKNLNALGESPTVKQIDNFISKTRADLSFAKGKSGVNTSTNAERIIKGNLAKLRESLNPKIKGNEALSKYWEANKTYSELSDFIDEGSSFLGKKTLSGDFAKDASVAKSSVQSILNGGKKDFLMRLEKLTGYKALDESVLALQAMADAGLYQGKSLLQIIQDVGIPTTKGGFTQKVLDMAIARGEKLIAGTPEEQTRALLQDLLNK